ncbi:MAG: hypothetical protein LAT64_01820 [Phycisphaerales bacterium]|nr:hypothetical protein [Planctomycetota bacterium]MCH8507499.1 hypothetical protein [Phycisphaerales bacterium]
MPARTALILLAITLAACLPEAPTAPSDPNSGPAVRLLDEGLAQPNPYAVLRAAAAPDQDALRDELRIIAWAPVAPAGGTDLQRAGHGAITVAIDAEFRQMVLELGAMHDSGDVEPGDYERAMRLLDAFLEGLLHSHRALDTAGVDPIASVLTYAALSRAVLSQELESRSLEPVLDAATRERLVDAARRADWAGLGAAP